MNKQRYLAELQRLLVFMTEEDRTLTVRRYADMFDEAGEDGADALIVRIGSPTKAAIALSRGYEPGSAAYPGDEPPEEAPRQPEPKPERTPAPDGLWDDLLDYDLPDYMAEDAPFAEESSEDEDDMPGGEAAYTGDDRVPAWDVPPDEPWREQAARGDLYTRSVPLGLGIPLFVLITAAIGIPLFVLAVAVMAALLAPGLAGIFGAYLSAVGGLWCISYVADAILLFGLAFLILAVGLIVLWAGVWIDAKIIDLCARGIQWLSGELLGRKVTGDE